MTLAQGAFLCLVFVFPIIGAVVAEWRSIDRVIVNLGDLPDDKYMNLHEIGGRRKEPLPENVATIGAVHLLSGPGSRSARRLPRGWWVLGRRRNFWAKKFAHGPCAMCQPKFLQARRGFAIVASTIFGDS